MLLWAVVGAIIAVVLINWGVGIIGERYDRRRHGTTEAQEGVFELRTSILCVLPTSLLAVEASIGLCAYALVDSNAWIRIGCIAIAILLIATLVGHARVACVVADRQQVISKNWFGFTEVVSRRELAAIAVAGFRNPVLAFVKKDGRPAFSIPQRWWRPDNVSALADFLGVPLRAAKKS